MGRAGRVPCRAVRGVHAGLQLSELPLGRQRPELQLDEPVRDQGGLLPRPGPASVQVRRRIRPVHLARGRDRQPRHVDLRPGPVLRRVGGGDCEPEESGLLHRVVSDTTRKTAEATGSTGTSRTSGSPDQPHAELRRPARHSVPLVQQPLDFDGPGESAGVHQSEDSRGDYNNLGPRVGIVVGRSGGRTDRRPCRIRALLSVPAAGARSATSNRTPEAERHQHPEPVVPRSVRRLCQRRRS